MDIKNRRTAGILALSALLAGGAGLAGCGTSAVSGAATVVTSGTATDTDTNTDTGTDSGSSYEVECRRGIVNDPYPGICHDYVDKDGNNICDLSEPDDSASSQAALASLSADDTDDGTTSSGCPFAPCVVCGICANLG